MNVLITGAAGFIGSSIANFFQEKGHKVTGWDILPPDPQKNLKKVNLLDCECLEAELRSIRPEIVIHCAGSADVGKSVQNPQADFTGNVVVTHNLLFSLHRAGLDGITFVYLSSAGIYGNPVSLPITEEMPANPLSPYAVHKVMCEDLCRFFAQHHHMNMKIVRIFSAYGAGLRKQIFWDMCRKYRDTGRLDMFGTGNESRDYIHVRDVCQAIWVIATRPSEDLVFNVANGEEVTIRKATEIVAANLKLSEDRIAFNGQVREGDPLNWRADISRLLRLGYQKTVAMEDGLRDYCVWAMKQENQ